MPILTQSTTVRNSSTGGAFAAITQAAPMVRRTYNGSTLYSDLAFTSVNQGDLLVCQLGGDFTSAGLGGVTAVGSVNSTGWAETVAPQYNAGWGGTIGMWWGQVEDVGSDLLTTAWTSATASDASWLNLWQFTCGQGATTIWSVDTAAGTSVRTGTGTAISGPTLTPVGTQELYMGGSLQEETGSTGATAGYTYGATMADGDIWEYNLSVAAVTTPTFTQSPSGRWTTIARLFRGQAGGTSNTAELTLNQVPTGRMWVISQIGFEILPASVLTTVVAKVLWNNRNLFGNINANGGSVQGPPFISMRGGDNLTIQWTGAPVGSSMIANFFYTEYDATASSSQIGQII